MTPSRLRSTDPLTVPSKITHPVGSPGGVFVHLDWLVFLLLDEGGGGLFGTRHGRKTLLELYPVPTPGATSMKVRDGKLENTVHGFQLLCSISHCSPPAR